MPAQTSKKHTAKRKRRTPSFFYRNPGKLDGALPLNVLILVVFGLVMLFSASYATAYYYEGDSYKYIAPQTIFAIAGVGIMFIVSLVDYHWLRQWTYPAYFLTLLMLAAVPLVGVELNGCKRWLNLKVCTVQPSELAKFVLILLMAHLMTAHSRRLKHVEYSILLPIAVLAPIEVLLYVEPHKSAMLLMLALTVIMMWAGGVALRWFVCGAGGLGVLGVAYLVHLHGGNDYAGNRLQDWLASFEDLTKASDQTVQSVYSIGNGGLLGVGIGNSNQKQLWLSEPQNDFIFSILCEELGFIGALICIALFVVLIVQAVRTAMRAPDRFGALLGVGVAAHISIQVLLNIAVVTNLIPNTGISLPFFSAGGTSLVMLLGEMGVLMSVNRAGNAAEARRREQEKAARDNTVQHPGSRPEAHRVTG